MNNIFIKIKQTCGVVLFIAAFLLYGTVNAQAPCKCSGVNFGFIMISGGGSHLKIVCGHDHINIFPMKCNTPYIVNTTDFGGCSPTCPGRIEYVLTSPTNQVFPSQPATTPFTLTENGTYTIQYNAWCGDTLCKTCKIRFTVSDCPDVVSCCPGQWGVRTIRPAGVAGGQGQSFHCGDSVIAKCKTPYQVSALYTCPPKCGASNVTYSVSPGGASISIGGVFTATQNGTYSVTTYGWCGGKICDSCVSYIVVKDCPNGNKCCPGRWTNITLLEGYISNQPIAKLMCGNTYDIKCNMPYTVNGDYICNNNNCNGYIAYKLSINGGPFYANSGTFTPTVSGIYTLILYGICNGDTCEKCPIKFKVTCDSPSNCCPGKWGDRTFGKVGASATILKCDKSYLADCNTDYQITAPYICPQRCGKGETTYTVSPTGATVSTSGIFSATANGIYTIQVYGSCNGKICDSCIFFIKVDDCPQTDCCPGKWGSKTFGGAVGGGVPFDCGKVVSAKCNIPYQVTANYLCPRPCGPNGIVSYSVSPVGATITTTGLFTATANGTYTVTIVGMCNGKICDSCILRIRVLDCPQTSCCPGTWGHKTIGEAGSASKQPFDCGKTVNVDCKTPYQITAPYKCPEQCGPGKVTYSVSPAGATVTGGVFTASTNGTYIVTLYGWCKNTLCDSCKLILVVDDCGGHPQNCCEKLPDVQGLSSQLTQQSSGGDAYTLYTANIQISGGMGVYQEIKASVVHFKLSGNYEQCISCKNKPFTWGSISGGTLAGITPTTTGGSPATGFNVPANPTENPREIVWNNGSVINTNTPQNITLNFYLPAASTIPCCDLSVDICIKITYKDTNCVLCEELFCGKIVIKKEGLRSDHQLFNGK